MQPESPFLPVFTLCNGLKEKNGLTFMPELVGIGDCEGDRDMMRYLEYGFYLIQAPCALYLSWRGKLPVYLWPEIKKQCMTRTLRQVAREYGASHESI